MLYRFHVVGLPNTQTSRQHNACAYTTKVYNFCKMMTERGHTVFHYGAEHSTAICAEHVDIISAAEQATLFGTYNSQELYKLDWNADLLPWQLCNARAAAAINKRREPRDFLCLIVGTSQQPIAKALPDMLCVEYGVGYTGVFSKYRVFESYAHMHQVWAHEGITRDGRFYDVVIPNYFDTADFPYEAKKDDYCLFVGRLVQRKGLEIAIRATKVAGVRLKIAGQGGLSYEPGKLVTADATYTGEHIEYVGHADIARRGELMSKACALLAPTLYVEPFGGVNVEAQLCGTPAITTNWGAFTETIEEGKTGYRCRTLSQFVAAVRKARHLDPAYIRARARKLYSLEAVALLYEDYFESLYDLWAGGWDTLERG